MSAPERREPQSEAARDSRPPSTLHVAALLPSSSLFVPTTAVPESTSPYQHHRHPPPRAARAIAFSISLSPSFSLYLSLGKVRLSGPSHSPYPYLRSRCLSNPLTNPLAHPPPLSSIRCHPVHVPSLHLSSATSSPTSTYHFYAWRCGCTTVPISVRSYRWCCSLPTYLPSWLVT